MLPIHENPHFTNFSRAAYELPHLVKKLPAAWHTQDSLTEDQYLLADAALHHASNTIETLLRGLEALGDVMLDAGSNEQTANLGSTMSGLGELVTHLAVELQYLRETEQGMVDLIATPAPSAPKSKGGSK